MVNLEDKIAKLCLDKYNSLKKTGKPSEKEWTVLSGIVLQDSFNYLHVVSLCTGTKCLSGTDLKNTKYEQRGNRLSDSHAEILARRAFIRYLYNQIDLILSNKESNVFYLQNETIKLKDISFHFFSSQTPCGDCSIIPKLKDELNDLARLSKKPKLDKCDNDINSEFGLEIVDVHRTGAKCVENEKFQDSHGQGVNYHTVGPLRTKPGRGDRTLSLSCSDKLAKWNIMGIQGTLLSIMIPTIKFSSITIGAGCPYSLESMERGLYKRFDSNIEAPLIGQSEMVFEHRKGNSRIRPCPSSIIWCAVPEKELEIAVDGLRQGGTKKKNKSCNLLISRKELFKTFLNIYDRFCKDRNHLQHPKKALYRDYKNYCLDYKNLWKEKLKIFPTWPAKPLHLQECLSF